MKTTNSRTLPPARPHAKAAQGAPAALLFALLLLLPAAPAEATDAAQGQRTLVVAGHSDLPPYEYLDWQGRPRGYAVEALSLVLDSLGLDYRFELRPGSQPIEMLRDGRADLMASVIAGDTARPWIRSGEPMKGCHPSVVTLENTPIVSVGDLHGRRLGLPDFDYAKSMLRQLRRFGVVPSDTVFISPREGFRMVETGQIDAYACDCNTAGFLTRHGRFATLREILLPLPLVELSFGATDTTLHALVNRHLMTHMADRDFLEMQARWFEVHSHTDPRAVAVVLAALLAVAVAGTVLVNRTRRQLKRSNEKAQRLNRELSLALRSGKMVGWSYWVEEDRFEVIDTLHDPDLAVTPDDILRRATPDEVAYVRRLIQRYKNGEVQNHTFEMTQHTSRGTLTYLVHSTLERDPKTGHTRMLGTLKDITDRKALRNENERLRREQLQMLEKMPLGFVIYDIGGELIHVNDVMRKLFGVDNRGEIIERHRNLYESPIFTDAEKDLFRRGIETRYSTNVDWNLVGGIGSATPEGWTGRLHIDVQVNYIRDSEGEPERVVIFVDDTTHLQEKIAELEQQSHFLDMALEIGNTGAMRYDADTQTLHGVSGRFRKGLSLNRLLEDVHPDSRTALRRAIDDLTQGRATEVNETLRFLRLEGRPTRGERYFKIRFLNVFDKLANDFRTLGTYRDVTDERHRERELEDSNHRTLQAIKASDQSIWEYDTRTQAFTLFNDAVNHFNPSQPAGRDTMLRFIHPQDLPDLEALIESLEQGADRPLEADFRIRTTYDEKWQYCTVTGAPLEYDHNGNVLRYSGVRMNNTRWVELQKELLEHKIMARFAMQQNDVTAWYFHRDEQRFEFDNPLMATHNMTSPERLLTITHPDDREATAAALAHLRDGLDSAHGLRWRYRLPGQQGWRHTTVRFQPLEVQRDGTVDSFVGCWIDETEWQELHQSVKEANEQFRLVLENSQTGLVFLDADFAPTWDNLHGRGTLRANLLTTLLQTIGTQQCVAVRSVQTNDTCQAEVEVDSHTFAVTAVPVTEGGGRVGTVMRCIDITAEKKMMQAAIKAKEKAEQSNRLKSSFISNMSHEIRTPLNAIIGFTELLMLTNDDEKRAYYKEIVNANSQLLLKLVGDVLDLARIEAGMFFLCPTQFDLADHFRKMADTFRPNNPPGVELACDIPAGPCLVVEDRDRLTQLVTNFVNNAQKFTTQGRITMSYSVVNDGLLLQVSDTGIGIPDDKKERVFERFAKLNTFAQGTGLGMSICKAIVDTKGGRIGFDSVEGKGSVFWAWLPTVFAQPAETDGAAAQRPADPAQAEPLRGLRILVADDNQNNITLVGEILGENNTLSTASNGALAVDLARRERFDCILMDLSMPVMSGVEATRAIRQFDTRTPIIALTAYAISEELDAALEAGCDRYITKPFSFGDLVSALAEVAGKTDPAADPARQEEHL